MSGRSCLKAGDHAAVEARASERYLAVIRPQTRAGTSSVNRRPTLTQIGFQC